MKKDNQSLETSTFKKIWSKVSNIRELSILIFLLVVGAIIAFNSPYFLTKSNLMSMIRSLASTAIMSIGMTLVIITAGIDLSVGTVLGLSSLSAAICFQSGLGSFVAIGVGLTVGIVFGLSNGLLITKMKLPPFIATLSTMSIGRGIMYIVTEGRPFTPKLPSSFKFLGQGYIGSVPFPILLRIYLLK